MHTIGPGDANDDTGLRLSAKTYSYKGDTFSSERQLVLRFLDDLRAAESFGGEVLALWAAVADSPLVRGGLRAICIRERSHGELLAIRLEEIGGACAAELSTDLRQAAAAHLASTEIADLDKLKDFLARYPDAHTAAKPIREVISQIDEDLETRALLDTIVDDEIATQRWIAATFKTLATRERVDTQVR